MMYDRLVQSGHSEMPVPKPIIQKLSTDKWLLPPIASKHEVCQSVCVCLFVLICNLLHLIKVSSPVATISI